MQSLLKYCDAPAPYPSFEGEKGKAKNAKGEVIRAKGREFNADLKIDTIDNPTLARICPLSVTSRGGIWASCTCASSGRLTDVWLAKPHICGAPPASSAHASCPAARAPQEHSEPSRYGESQQRAALPSASAPRCCTRVRPAARACLCVGAVYYIQIRKR